MQWHRVGFHARRLRVALGFGWPLASGGHWRQLWGHLISFLQTRADRCLRLSAWFAVGASSSLTSNKIIMLWFELFDRVREIARCGCALPV